MCIKFMCETVSGLLLSGTGPLLFSVGYSRLAGSQALIGLLSLSLTCHRSAGLTGSTRFLKFKMASALPNKPSLQPGFHFHFLFTVTLR